MQHRIPVIIGYTSEEFRFGEGKYLRKPERLCKA